MERRIQIDGDKLLNEVKKRGVTLREASVEIGMSSSYLGNCRSRGNMSGAAMLALKHTYNIDEPDIAVQKGTGNSAGDETAPAKVDTDELYRVIYSAVYEAVKAALEG